MGRIYIQRDIHMEGYIYGKIYTWTDIQTGHSRRYIWGETYIQRGYIYGKDIHMKDIYMEEHTYGD